VIEAKQAQPAGTKPSRSRSLGRLLVLGVLLTPLLYFAYSWLTFPSDKTPEGAYLRVVRAVNEARPAALFAYTEEAAQHACFTIRDYRKDALGAARGSYPQEELQALELDYGPYAQAPDGSDVFALIATEQGWLEQLRADVSGIKRVTVEGPRATVETAKGTRYSLRRRPGGIWGLTAFTPILVEEAERAARDLEQVKKAAADFARVEKQMPHK
jgi:hypothetical protein